MTTRCSWASGEDVLMREYHDTEWGVPHHGDDTLFELLCLEGAQAGLSWRSVLTRREGYRAAFHGFAIERVAAMTDLELADVLANGAIIRNRLKVWSVRDNARAALTVAGGLDQYLWEYVDGRTVANRWSAQADVPATTGISDRMSKDLKKRGFRFVGSTICYAFMQASGMVNDHPVTCVMHGR